MKIIALGLACVVIGCQASPIARKELPLVGVWQLESWSLVGDDGAIEHPFGETPMGQLIYFESGIMSLQLMKPGPQMDGDKMIAIDDVVAKVSERFFAYYGSYFVNEEMKTITHVLQACIAPTWVGEKMVRNYELLKSDKLRLWVDMKSDTNVPGRNELIWSRIE